MEVVEAEAVKNQECVESVCDVKSEFSDHIYL